MKKYVNDIVENAAISLSRIVFKTLERNGINKYIPNIISIYQA